jgi:uncharacterized protein (TIGR02145 family)
MRSFIINLSATLLLILVFCIDPCIVKGQYISPNNAEGKLKPISQRRAEEAKASEQKTYDAKAQAEKLAELRQKQSEEKLKTGKAATVAPAGKTPVGQYSGDLRPISYGTKYTYINDKTDKNGLRYVETKNKVGYINAAGEEAIPVIYDEAAWSNFSDGLYGVRLGKNWQFVDKNNIVQIPIFYDRVVSNFWFGKSTVEKDGRKFDINEKGEVLKEYTNAAPTKGFSTVVNARDGSKISCIKIGKQDWTLYNLDVSTYRNGDPIIEAKSKEEWEKADRDKKPAFCYNRFEGMKDEKLGKLYNWYAVNDPRGLAPEGFHIPTHEEWTKLIKFLGTAKACLKMQSLTGWLYNNGTDVYNESGFSALPVGIEVITAAYNLSAGNETAWWSSTECDAVLGWCRELNGLGKTVGTWGHSKGDGLSVRCIKD